MRRKRCDRDARPNVNNGNVYQSRSLLLNRCLIITMLDWQERSHSFSFVVHSIDYGRKTIAHEIDDYRVAFVKLTAADHYPSLLVS